MTSIEGPPPPASPITEIVVSTGDRYRVAAGVRDAERTILDAARGSILQLAWFITADTREDVALNPDHVVMLRAVDS